MGDDLDAFADLHHENETLRGQLEQKQVEIHGLWRTIARAHSLWQQAELENRKQTMQIRRLEDLLRHEDPEKTPPCSPPTI